MRSEDEACIVHGSTQHSAYLILRHTPILVVFALLVPAVALEFLGKVDHYSSVGKLKEICEIKKPEST